jgi:membrane-bound lytic murein transglycosylase D
LFVQRSTLKIDRARFSICACVLLACSTLGAHAATLESAAPDAAIVVAPAPAPSAGAVGASSDEKAPAPVPTTPATQAAAQSAAPAPLPATESTHPAVVSNPPTSSVAADAQPPVAAPGTAMPAAIELAPGLGGNAAPVVSAAAVDPRESDLWARIRRGFKMPDLDNKRSRSSTRWYAEQPDYIARMTGRASMYLYHIVEEIEKRGMPMELALLPFVESAMEPEAVSSAKAAGLWQFIPSTGKLYSLEQTQWKDERFGVIESTRAALDYLQKLHDEFGDWQLALAAYNCGEMGVEKALARARTQHHSLAYQDLRLPRETQYYVPKLQAIKNIVADPGRFNIELPAIRNEPYFVAINQALDMDVSTAARLAQMQIDDFRELNPAFSRPVIVGASSPTLLIPADHAEAFQANLAAWKATGQPLASWTVYTLQSSDTVAKVAERVGVSEAQLRNANRIPPRYRPAVGSIILVPRDETTNEDIAADFITASLALVPESNNLHQITIRVRRGDSLASIARRWHVSADDIAAWNNLRTMSLFAGQRLSLTVPRSAPSTAHKSAKRPQAAGAAAGNTPTPASSPSRM